MRTPSIVITFAVVVTAAAAAGLIPPLPAARAEPPARATARMTVDVTVVEPSGNALAERRITVPLGGSETVTVRGRSGRTVSVQATVGAGAKVGCTKVDLVVRDRRIDGTGHFNKTVWQSATEPCDSQPITLGPKDETRVRISVHAGR